MFWIVSGLIVGILFALYFTFSSLAGGSSQFSKLEEVETKQVQEFLSKNLQCRSGVAYLREYKGKTWESSIPLKDKVVVLSEKSVDNNLLEITIEGRLDGQHVTFWIREGIKDELTNSLTTPFLFYLRGNGSYSSMSEEKSLLARSEFSLVIPYIFGKSSTINTFMSDYANGPITFQTYVLAEITSVIDYVTTIYDSPKVILYGEAWGSVLARELALIDDRVDLVISNKFAGDPTGTLVENGFYLQGVGTNQAYLHESVRCLPKAVTNFIDLVPTPHIYLGPSVYNSFYSIGTSELAQILEGRYSSLGLGNQFSYIELDNLDHTYTEEVINSIYESLGSTN